MTTLLLVRHGETFDNENQIMQGQTQGQLNPRGIEQAQLLAGEMAQRSIDAFVASDLNRSIETCRIIAEPHNAEVITTPLLRERDWEHSPDDTFQTLKACRSPMMWRVLMHFCNAPSVSSTSLMNISKGRLFSP